MGKGNRGFKPQGVPNPILMARLSRPVQTEAATRHRLDRDSRPSWEEVKRIADKKQKNTSEFLEQWENDNYREELKVNREKKRGDQQRQYLKQLGHVHHSREGHKRKKKREKSYEAPGHSGNTSPAPTSASSSHSHSRCTLSDRRASPESRKHRREPGEKKLNPFKFSNFLRIKSKFD